MHIPAWGIHSVKVLVLKIDPAIAISTLVLIQQQLLAYYKMDNIGHTRGRSDIRRSILTECFAIALQGCTASVLYLRALYFNRKSNTAGQRPQLK